jgi:hypothetical protein
VRLVQGRDVLSDLLAKPGPTGGFFDALAACATALAPANAQRLLLLGFAAGGLVAPLRALGWGAPIEAVDLSRAAEPLFRKVSRHWVGDVHLWQAEASAWLRRHRRRWDVVVEDLTVPGPEVAVKPSVSTDVLPALVKSRLQADGIVVVNALPIPGMTWDELLALLTAPYGRALLVTFRDYENRIVIGGEGLPEPRRAAALVRAALAGIGSRQSGRLRMRALGCGNSSP